MADGGALRVLFAELGFDVDEAALRAANTRVNEVAQSLKEVVPASAAAESAVVSAAKAADDALKPVGRTAAALVDAVTELGETWGAFQARRLAQTEVLAKATEASMGVSAEVQRDIDAAAREVEQAEKRKQDAIKQTAAEEKKRGDGVRAARTSYLKRWMGPQESARREREDHAIQQRWSSSDAGKAQAAWRSLRDAEEAAKKPITGWGSILGAVHARASVVLGRQMPALFRNLAQRAGVDLATVGRFILGSLTAATVAAAGLVASTHAFADHAEALRDTAREARTTSQALQSFQFAGAASGVGADRMTQGLTHLAQSMRAAEMHLGGNGIGWQLRRLGVDMRDSARLMRDPVDVSLDVAVALDRVQSPARRAREALRVYGDAGRRMLDIMHPGPGGLAALIRRFRELGGGVTAEATAAARDYARSQAELGVATDSLRSVLAVGLLPAMTWFVTKAADIAAYLSKITKNSRIVQASFVALGVTAAAVALATIGVWGPVVAPILAVAAAVAGLALVFDDLWVFIQGGDSALGRFLDKSQGKGFSAGLAHEQRELWHDIAEFCERAANAVGRFGGWLRGSAGGRLVRALGAGLSVNTTTRRPGETDEEVRDRSSRAFWDTLHGNDVERDQPIGPQPDPDAPMPNVPVVRRGPKGQAYAQSGDGPRTPLYGAGQGQAPWITPLPAPVAAPVVVPWRGVPWRVPERPGGDKVVSTRDNRITLNLYGITVPEAARQAVTLIQRQQQEERDSDHPGGDDDEGAGPVGGQAQ